MMERRSFIKGLLVSAGAGTALVKLAVPGEAEALVVQREVMLGHLDEERCIPNLATPEIYMRRADGAFQCVGFCTHVEVKAGWLEPGIGWEGQVIIVPGMRGGTLYFEGRR